MLVPVSWLKSYTELDVPMDVFCERMVMSGSNIEAVEEKGAEFENVRIGRVLRVEPHPNADRLVVVYVDVGTDEPVQICTGAPNVVEGAFVPVALDGSRIPGPLHGQEKVEGGVVLKAGELRGVLSNGMLCDFSELGFTDSVIPVKHRDGIWIIDGEYEPGSDLVKTLGLDETVIEFEITPNRPDCLSMVGMAREAAAVFGHKLRMPETDCARVSDEPSSDHIKISIENPELCRRYAGRVVKDVRIGASPLWLQHRLMSAGMRPINNIVDITNYVMLEYGQPIHAFDLRHIRGGEIRVGTAANGEKFTTLDGQERTMTDDMLMIRDAEGSIAIAGVMGGLDSEIRSDTSTILVESANFSGDSVRQTSKKLGLRTEASSRFEKGIDPNLAGQACDRVCHLIEQLGAGTVLSGTVDVYPSPRLPVPCDIRPERIARIIGIDLSEEEIEGYLNALEMTTEHADGKLRVTPPTVRQDLTAEIDYVEEVARMHGYDRLPMTMPKSNVESLRTQRQMIRDEAKTVLAGQGVNEIQTYSFVSPKSVDRIGLAPEDPAKRFVQLLNPLGEDTSVMRTVLLPNMLDVFVRNTSRSVEAMRAYELGNTFLSEASAEVSDSGLPCERESLCIAVFGDDESFFTLKGIIEQVLAVLGVGPLDFEAESRAATYHPGRCARISCGGKLLGLMGQLNPAVQETYDLARPVYAAELSFEDVYCLVDLEKKYRPLPKYPAMKRDFALVVTEEVRVADIEREIRAQAGELLESVQLFDIYRGGQVPKGSKSIAFSLTYRAGDRTLKEAEVNEINERVLAALKQKHRAVLREM